jgi:integrase/recombinase XerD
MKDTHDLPVLLERFFTQRLMAKRRASAHTIASYRDTFRLLLRFVQLQLRKAPSLLSLTDLQAPLIGAFLDDLESARSITARSRDLRLTAGLTVHSSRWLGHESIETTQIYLDANLA